MSPGFRVWQTKPGTPVEITQDLEEGKVWFDETKKSSLKRNGQELTAAFFESGVILMATAYPWVLPGEYYINFQIRIPKLMFFGRTRGLLGNLDDDDTNDLHRKGSTVLLPGNLDRDVLTEHLKTCEYRMHACSH